MPFCTSFYMLNAHDTADGVLLHMYRFTDLNLLATYDISYPKLARYKLNLRTSAVDISTRDWD